MDLLGTWLSDLMAPDQQLQAIVVQEALGDIRAKAHADAALAGGPPGAVCRVAPQQLAHEAILWRLPARRHTVFSLLLCSAAHALQGRHRSRPCLGASGTRDPPCGRAWQRGSLQHSTEQLHCFCCSCGSCPSGALFSSTRLLRLRPVAKACHKTVNNKPRPPDLRDKLL